MSHQPPAATLLEDGMSMNLPFMRAASAVRAYCSNLTSAVHWMHPSWTMALLRMDRAAFRTWSTALARASDESLRNVSVELCRCAGIDFATPLHAFSESFCGVGAAAGSVNLSLLDVCTPATGVQILRMRAVWFRRAETRRIIDKHMRMKLSEWTGVSVTRLCGAAMNLEGAAPQNRVAGPSLAELDADALSAEGLALIERDIGDTARASLNVLRCALPKVLPAVSSMRETDAAPDARDTLRLFERLPELLPEWKWLFG